MNKSGKKDFSDVTPSEVFVVNVYDYILNKSFDSKQKFNSYDEAVKWIKNYDFVSEFGKNPLGISITSSPNIDFGSISF